MLCCAADSLLCCSTVFCIVISHSRSTVTPVYADCGHGDSCIVHFSRLPRRPKSVIIACEHHAIRKEADRVHGELPLLKCECLFSSYCSCRLVRANSCVFCLQFHPPLQLLQLQRNSNLKRGKSLPLSPPRKASVQYVAPLYDFSRVRTWFLTRTGKHVTATVSPTVDIINLDVFLTPVNYYNSVSDHESCTCSNFIPNNFLFTSGSTLSY